MLAYDVFLYNQRFIGMQSKLVSIGKNDQGQLIVVISHLVSIGVGEGLLVGQGMS